jgi:hypothetical protein
MTLADEINAELRRLDLIPLNEEQLACLADPQRVDEAAAMLDDLQARCRVRLKAPQGDESGPFESYDEALEEAEEMATRFEAVAIDEMSTDEHRSYGGVEYYVSGFNGPDAALNAARRDQLGYYWVKGERHEVNAEE